MLQETTESLIELQAELLLQHDIIFAFPVDIALDKRRTSEQ